MYCLWASQTLAGGQVCTPQPQPSQQSLCGSSEPYSWQKENISTASQAGGECSPQLTLAPLTAMEEALLAKENQTSSHPTAVLFAQKVRAPRPD